MKSLINNSVMADEQLKLLNGPDKRSLDGPIFDFGPGWGFYVKRWLGKYLFKLILPIIVLIVAMGLYISRNGTESGEKTTADNETVKIVVLRGDGPVLAARRALAEYLKSYPEELTAGQKIFIEEILRKVLGEQKLVAGEEIGFDLNRIKEAISQSKNLSLYQLQVWEGYARKIKLE